MLILSRTLNQSILIGEGPDAVQIKVFGIGRGGVRLGIFAAPEVPVNRAEVVGRADLNRDDREEVAR